MGCFPLDYEPYRPHFFFFQAEDGIRDLTVTGVQTCALPILCHQLSNGPDASIARAPQIATHAPSGPRKPQNVTPAACSSTVAENVVRRTSQPHAAPASTPPR